MPEPTSQPLDLMTMVVDAEAPLRIAQEVFCTAAQRNRQAVIRSLRAKLPHLTDEEADLAFVDAVIRCLRNGDYLRFDPDSLSLKGGFGLIAHSCADHMLRSVMVPAPTATNQDRRMRVRFVPLPSEEGDRHVPAAFQVPDLAEAVMRKDWIRKGLGSLPEQGRRAIQAYFWDELRGAGLAKALGVSEDHAKKPVHRAIKYLRQALIGLVGGLILQSAAVDHARLR